MKSTGEPPRARRNGIGPHRAAYFQPIATRDDYSREIALWTERYPKETLRELAKLTGYHGELAQAALRQMDKLPEEKK